MNHSDHHTTHQKRPNLASFEFLPSKPGYRELDTTTELDPETNRPRFVSKDMQGLGWFPTKIEDLDYYTLDEDYFFRWRSEFAPTCKALTDKDYAKRIRDVYMQTANFRVGRESIPYVEYTAEEKSVW